MGKTANFLRSLLGSKKNKKTKSADYNNNKFKNDDPLASPYVDGLDANKHAIAVAAATAAVAEAALAAAQAAAEVVRLTSGAGSGRNVPLYVSSERRRVAAAIVIQSAFRAYLSKRALRALKGLVKLQALVRGHIVRKQSADMLRRMQAMARIQARASATRSDAPEYSKTNSKFSNYHSSGVANPRNYHSWSDNAKQLRTSTNGNRESSHMASNWLNHWIEQYSWNNRGAASHDTSHGDDERSDKILEIDTWKPRQTSKPTDRAFPAIEHQKMTSFSKLSAKLQKPNPSISSEEVSSVISSKEVDQVAVWTAESSPRVHSASSRPTRGVFTPTRSECSRSVMGDYLSHPSYMANTESSRAKVRSQSAPKQRMQLDELGVSSTFGRNAWESDSVSEKGYALKMSYGTNIYQRSSHLKRQGINTGGAANNGNGISSSYGYRF